MENFNKRPQEAIEAKDNTFMNRWKHCANKFKQGNYEIYVSFDFLHYLLFRSPILFGKSSSKYKLHLMISYDGTLLWRIFNQNMIFTFSFLLCVIHQKVNFTNISKTLTKPKNYHWNKRL